MKNPKVSIIIPIYNCEEYLSQCIESILSQTFNDFELILVDDCSKDNSVEICKKYQRIDDRIKILINEINVHSSLTRKNGLNISSGAYILYIDSDDWIEKNMIEKMYNKAISDNYDIVICDYIYEKKDAEKVSKQNVIENDNFSLLKSIIAMKVSSVLWNKLIKRELYLQADYPIYSGGEDYVITIQNVYNAKKIGYISEPLYHYRFNEVSSSNNPKTRLNWRTRENQNWQIIIDYLISKYGDIKIFEPELSNHINYLKRIYKTDKFLRKHREFFKLYPESNYFKWNMNKKIEKIRKSILRRLNNLLKKDIKQ